MEAEFVAKALGFLAFGVSCYGYLGKSDRRLKLCVSLAAGLLSVHYFLLGALVAGINLAINFARNQIAMRRSGLPWFLGFAALQVSIGVALYSRPLDLFPVIGSLLSGYALFCLRGLGLRAFMLLCTLMWLTVNLSLGSYGAVAQDALSAAMNLAGMARIWKERSAQKVDER